MTDPWLERWAQGRIGFHEDDGNAALRRHWQASGKRVLVPLCGKSRDLLWLEAQGNEVVGVEFAELAVKAFFAENGIALVHDGRGRYQAEDRAITIHCGDYFRFEAGRFDALYDRAALVALPPSLRPDYARKTAAMLAPDAYQLVITLEYEQALIDGPPWSVAGEEVEAYWPALERIEARDDLANTPPRFIDAGVTDILEVVWRSRSAA